MGKEPEQTFLQRYNSQAAHEKMLHIIRQKRNINRIHNEAAFHTHCDGYHENMENNKLTMVSRNWNSHIPFLGM